MTWIDHLIGFVPDTAEGLGTLCMLGGVVAAGVALMLENLPFGHRGGCAVG